MVQVAGGVGVGGGGAESVIDLVGDLAGPGRATWDEVTWGHIASFSASIKTKHDALCLNANT